jgi:hypothetical protein
MSRQVINTRSTQEQHTIHDSHDEQQETHNEHGCQIVKHILVLPLGNLPIRKPLTLDLDVYINSSLKTFFASVGYANVSLHTIGVLLEAPIHAWINEFLAILFFLSVLAKAGTLVARSVLTILAEFGHFSKRFALGSSSVSEVIHTQVSSHCSILYKGG